MRTLLLTAAALLTLGATPAQADEAAARAAAIQACRTDIAAQTGLAPAAIRVDQTVTRATLVKVRFDVKDGSGQTHPVTCTVKSKAAPVLVGLDKIKGPVAASN